MRCSTTEPTALIRLGVAWLQLTASAPWAHPPWRMEDESGLTLGGRHTAPHGLFLWVLRPQGLQEPEAMCGQTLSRYTWPQVARVWHALYHDLTNPTRPWPDGDIQLALWRKEPL
jgi:hypothetical protein